MAMTRKDYAEIAAALSDLYTRGSDGGVDRSQIALVADTLADRLAALNPNFDRTRFVAASLVDLNEILRKLGYQSTTEVEA
jgi:hypothetical protein